MTLNTALILMNVAFLALYVGALVVLYYFLGYLPLDIPILDLVLLGLATARLSDVLSTDEIMRWVRRPFVTVRRVEMAGKQVQIRTGKGRGLRKAIGDLLACPWCVGIWIGAGLTYLYFLFTNIIWLFVLVMAIAEIGSLVQTLSTIMVRTEKYLKVVGEREEEV